MGIDRKGDSRDDFDISYHQNLLLTYLLYVDGLVQKRKILPWNSFISSCVCGKETKGERKIN